jgi:hypothetical protein
MSESADPSAAVPLVLRHPLRAAAGRAVARLELLAPLRRRGDVLPRVWSSGDPEVVSAVGPVSLGDVARFGTVTDAGSPPVGVASPVETTPATQSAPRNPVR